MISIDDIKKITDLIEQRKKIAAGMIACDEARLNLDKPGNYMSSINLQIGINQIPLVRPQQVEILDIAVEALNNQQTEINAQLAGLGVDISDPNPTVA